VVNGKSTLVGDQVQLLPATYEFSGLKADELLDLEGKWSLRVGSGKQCAVWEKENDPDLKLLHVSKRRGKGYYEVVRGSETLLQCDEGLTGGPPAEGWRTYEDQRQTEALLRAPALRYGTHFVVDGAKDPRFSPFFGTYEWQGEFVDGYRIYRNHEGSKLRGTRSFEPHLREFAAKEQHGWIFEQSKTAPNQSSVTVFKAMTLGTPTPEPPQTGWDFQAKRGKQEVQKVQNFYVQVHYSDPRKGKKRNLAALEGPEKYRAEGTPAPKMVQKFAENTPDPATPVGNRFG